MPCEIWHLIAHFKSPYCVITKVRCDFVAWCLPLCQLKHLTHLVLRPGPRLNIKTVFPGMGIPMLKKGRSWDYLIFNMKNPITARRHFYIQTPPEYFIKINTITADALAHCTARSSPFMVRKLWIWRTCVIQCWTTVQYTIILMVPQIMHHANG